MWADSQRRGTQGMSLRGAHPYIYLALPSTVEIPCPILLKQIAPYLQLSMRRSLQASLHLWDVPRTDWKRKPFQTSQSLKARLFHSQGIDSAQRDTT